MHLFALFPWWVICLALFLVVGPKAYFWYRRTFGGVR